MRKRWRWNPEINELVEVSSESDVGTQRMIIIPDIEPFVSPIDGKVVSGRAALRAHNKVHSVTNSADFKETWEKQRKERERAFTPGSGYGSSRRKEHIKRALEKLNGR